MRIGTQHQSRLMSDRSGQRRCISNKPICTRAQNRFLCPKCLGINSRVWTQDGVHGRTRHVDRRRCGKAYSPMVEERLTLAYMISGKRNATQLGWETVFKEMGLANKVSPAGAQKKWGELKKN